MQPSLIAFALLFFGHAFAIPSPQASATLSPSPKACRIPSYDSFKLYATRLDTSERYPVRLFRENATDPSAIVKTYAVVNTSRYQILIYPCYSCGIVPEKWFLRGQNLIAEDYTLPDSAITINNDVVDYGTLPFTGGHNVQPTAPIYCAVKSSNAYGYPLLAVHGSTSDFVMCRLELAATPSEIYTIRYKAPEISFPEYRCYPITLTLE